MEVSRPPNITIAIGLTISRPATLPMITNGNTAAAVATATVNVGATAPVPRAGRARRQRPGSRRAGVAGSDRSA